MAPSDDAASGGDAAPGGDAAGSADVTLSGEITAYLEALGMHPADPRLTPVLDLPGPTTDTNEEREPGGNVVFHLAARSSGTEFMFSGEQLVAVFVGTQPREAWGAYPRPDALIDGLPGTAWREEVRATLGEPVWQQDGADRFAVGTDYLQFQYRDDRVEVIVAAIGERA